LPVGKKVWAGRASGKKKSSGENLVPSNRKKKLVPVKKEESNRPRRKKKKKKRKGGGVGPFFQETIELTGKDGCCKREKKIVNLEEKRGKRGEGYEFSNKEGSKGRGKRGS